MVETTEQITLCKTCEKPIVASKFRMHEAQCLKLNKRCEKCNKVILKSEFDQHLMDEHTDKPKPVIA
jgi:hypothetical protein